MPFSMANAIQEAKSPPARIGLPSLFQWPDASSSLNDSMKLGIPSMYTDAMAEALKQSEDGDGDSHGSW